MAVSQVELPCPRLMITESSRDTGLPDGPFPFTSGANTLRAVPYKIGVEGRVEDFLMMGGQRWQCFRLRSAGRITLTEIGFRPTVS
jgi:hypothetical protein